MTFQFDTSGFVYWRGTQPFAHLNHVAWADLSPFVQGYVEEMFSTEIVHGEQRWTGNLSEFRAFSDLAPETLARIMAYDQGHVGYANSVTGGRNYWEENPPTPYLGTDGKIYFKEN